MLPRAATITSRLDVSAPSGARLHGLLLRPRHVAEPLPAVIMVPGGVGAGRTMVQRPGAQRLAREGWVLASFNAEGRSSGKLGDRRSGGTCDFNGHRDQDGLAQVVRAVAALPAVDASRLGIYALSFGLVAAAGCLARHPDLPVAWLLDQEGPSDCCASMLCAWRQGEEDRSVKARELFGHRCPKHGGGPADAAFWAQRDALACLTGFRGRYLRLQAERDHVQPPWFAGQHAVDLVNAAVAGGVPWVRVNLAAQGNPLNRIFPPQQPPTWIPGSMAAHPELWVQAALDLASTA